LDIYIIFVKKEMILIIMPIINGYFSIVNKFFEFLSFSCDISLQIYHYLTGNNPLKKRQEKSKWLARSLLPVKV